MLKFHYFGHLMRRIDSLEKTLKMGKIEGRRRRGWQKTRWLYDITNSVDMNLSKLWAIVKGREAWHAQWQRVELDWVTEQQATKWEATLHQRNWAFFLLWGCLMIISHLCQQKAFSQFSNQMKPRLKVDRELIQFWHILCEEAKAESCRKGRGYDWCLKMKLTTGNQLVWSHILIIIQWRYRLCFR